jgi:hypothetical protein
MSSMPDRLAILKRQPEDLSWIARLADSPAAEFPGVSPSEALGSLLQGNGWSMSEVELNTDQDRTNLSSGHAEVIITLRRPDQGTVCPECRGLRQHVGLNAVWACETCCGRGVI